MSIHAIRKANVKQGATCIVFGAGAVGLLCAAVAKVEHRCPVVIADIDAGRVQFALDEGFADIGFTVTPQRPYSTEEKLAVAKNVASDIGNLQWPRGEQVSRPEFVFECTGVESCVQASICVSRSFHDHARSMTKFYRLSIVAGKSFSLAWVPRFSVGTLRRLPGEKSISFLSGDMCIAIHEQSRLWKECDVAKLV